MEVIRCWTNNKRQSTLSNKCGWLSNEFMGIQKSSHIGLYVGEGNCLLFIPVQSSSHVFRKDCILPSFTLYPELIPHGHQVSICRPSTPEEDISIAHFEIVTTISHFYQELEFSLSDIQKHLSSYLKDVPIHTNNYYLIVHEKQFLILKCLKSQTESSTNSLGKLTEDSCVVVYFSPISSFEMLPIAFKSSPYLEEIQQPTFEEIKKRLALKDLCGSLVLEGGSGSGKTCILFKVAEHLSSLRIPFRCLDGVFISSMEKANGFIDECCAMLPCFVVVDNFHHLVENPHFNRLFQELSQTNGVNLIVVSPPSSAPPLDKYWKRALHAISLTTVTLDQRAKLFSIFLSELGLLSSDSETETEIILEMAKECVAYSARDVKRVSDQMRVVHVQKQKEDKPTNLIDIFRIAQIQAKVPSPSHKEGPKLNWDNVGGYAREKKRMQLILRQWKDETKEPSSRGLLLHGPSGCGKSLFADIISHEDSLKFVELDMSLTLSKYLGESEENLRKVFKLAREQTPCVLFIDEIDIIGGHRVQGDNGAEQGVQKRMLSTLLNELDGISSNKRVFVLACTQSIEDLDSALIRPGRLDEKIYLGLPHRDQYEDILRACLGRMSTRELDLKQIVEKIDDGVACSHLFRVASSAGKQAVKRIIEGIENGTEHYEDSEMRIEMGDFLL